MQTKNELLIRWRIGRDDRELLAIDDRCYIESMTQRDLKDILSDRRVICVVAEDAGKIIGYCIYQLQPKAIRIIRCGVDPRSRRCGAATAFLDRFKTRLLSDRRRIVWVDVAGDSIAAQLCLSRAGFVAEPLPLDMIRFEFRKEMP